MTHANNIVSDQPAHPRSLNRDFVVHYKFLTNNPPPKLSNLLHRIFDRDKTSIIQNLRLVEKQEIYGYSKSVYFLLLLSIFSIHTLGRLYLSPVRRCIIRCMSIPVIF